LNISLLLNMKSILTSAALAAVSAREQDNTCYAASFQMGGSGGVFEVGALWGMFYALKDLGKQNLMQYDSVSGVSVGSINAFFVALTEKGQEEAMVNELSDLWNNLHNSDVLTNRTHQILSALDGKGLYDDQPLLNFLDGVYEKHNKTIKRALSMGSVDLNSGTFMVFNETISNPPKAVVSSSSIELMFPTQVWPELNLVNADGGLVHKSDMISAINRCKQMGYDEENITIDVIDIHKFGGIDPDPQAPT
jgi:predicted acylesterase/phospholipase RssA